MITIIAAVAANRAIGFENKLLYWLPNDLKRFKALTTGHTIIMGRRTFESLPKGALPNRRNVVLSHTATEFEGCDCYPSLQEALAHCTKDEDIYIIGGAGARHSRPTLPYRDSRHTRRRRRLLPRVRRMEGNSARGALYGRKASPSVCLRRLCKRITITSLQDKHFFIRHSRLHWPG